MVWGSLDKLYYQRFWPPDNPNSSLHIRPVGRDAKGSLVLKFRGDHDHVRGFFRLVRSRGGRDLPQVLIDDFALTHDEEARIATAVLSREVTEAELNELTESSLKFPVDPEQRPSGPLPGRPGTRYRLRLNVSYEDIESAMTWAYSTANIQPTAEQIDAISAPAPILINGQAGTGKTSMLAIRAAWVTKYIRSSRLPGTILCTAYSRPVVEVLKGNVRDVLLYKLHDTAAPEQGGTCDLQPFPSLLLGQLNESEQAFYSHRENRVTFGRFNREFFQQLKHHGVLKRDASAEFVWYAIRSFLKGYGEDRVLTIDDFGSISGEGVIPKKLTRELTKEEIETAISIFDRYTRWLCDNSLFDDIDLARAVWDRIKEEPPHKYDEVYLDEAQDLTRIEFRILEAMLKPQSDIPARGIRLVLAGDPLQTIHPTGFNWRGVKALFYQGEELRQTNLDINHRTPQPIVDLANAIQRRRSHYGSEELVMQEAREQAGIKPTCYQVESSVDDDALVELLKNPRPGTALIVWADDDFEIVQLLKEDRHINRAARELLGDHKVDEILSEGVDSANLDTLTASMLLHSVSETKGQEFERVILYKFASNPRFAEFAQYTVEDLPTRGEFQARIPILYHLNRLYVAITRSTRNLFIIDKPEAVEKVWARVPEIDLSRVRQLHSLQSDPALSADEHLDWVQRGRQYLDMFHEEHVTRWLVHALTCLERAKDNAEARALIVEVRAEIKEQEATLLERKNSSGAAKTWREAGELWDENPIFYLKAAKCFVCAEAWPDVERVLSASTTLSPLHKGWYLFAKLQNSGRGAEDSSAHEYLEFLEQNRDLPRNEEWIATLSRRLLSLEDAENLIKLHGEVCWNQNRGELKHPSILVEALASLGRWAEIVRFVEQGGLQKHLWKAYSEALRKLALQSESQGDWAKAGDLWRSVAQQAPDQETNGKDYALGGAAFARAALGGRQQHWSDAASCYTEAGSAYSRHQAISEAEAAARVGGFLPAIKAIAPALVRDWVVDGPLRDAYSDKFCRERIITWASTTTPKSLAGDWDGLNASVEAYLFLGRRSESKTWLREIASKAGGRASLVFHKLASMEEEDHEYPLAIKDLERAGDFERAWSLGQKHAQELTPSDLARLEGMLLASRYEHQRDPLRADADRAIELLTESGEVARAKEIESLRFSRETDPLEKVRLAMGKGVNPDSFMTALRLPSAGASTESRAFLLETLAQNPSVREKAPEEIRAMTKHWLSDPNLQRSLRERLSLEEYGVAVEFAGDEQNAKEFFLAESAQHNWARDAYRRTIRRLIRDTLQPRRTGEGQEESVETLEKTLAEAEKNWKELAPPRQGPSGADLLLMRSTLESEPISRLRERCKEAGLPEISGASKGILVEVYFAYWVGTQKNVQANGRAEVGDNRTNPAGTTP